MRDYSFGNFLHELRSRRGLTQYQLGALVGVSDKAVSKWENGSSKPQSNILYKLSDVLGISVDELLICKYHSSEKKDTALKKRLTEFAVKYPSECRLIDDDGNGCLTFEVSKGRFGFKLTVPYDEKRRKATSELAKKNTERLRRQEQ